ncbi:hypothetical protein [Terasakiella pusilla]|uniref:hypothetical protein n=1 Tax=Terasakiella pusilla TaxID=64973 RepID=UPI003AA80755
MAEPNIRARFFESNGFDHIEIRIVGSPDTVIRKAKPEDISRFPEVFEAYRGGKKEEVVGTPLEDIPGMSPSRAVSLRLKGVRVAEEVAALDDAPAKAAIGMGWLDLRKAAQNVVELAQLKDKKPTRRRKSS